jgi:hypothetical protein
MQKAKFLIFCTIFVVGGAYCQGRDDKSSPRVSVSVIKKPLDKLFFPSVTEALAESVRKPLLPSDYYFTHLGFFCKKELKLENATGVPFKFRLGSLQECDRLEGKRLSRLP